jgi:hypothetical protein
MAKSKDDQTLPRQPAAPWQTTLPPHPTPKFQFVDQIKSNRGTSMGAVAEGRGRDGSKGNGTETSGNGGAGRGHTRRLTETMAGKSTLTLDDLMGTTSSHPPPVPNRSIPGKVANPTAGNTRPPAVAVKSSLAEYSAGVIPSFVPRPSNTPGFQQASQSGKVASTLPSLPVTAPPHPIKRTTHFPVPTTATPLLSTTMTPTGFSPATAATAFTAPPSATTTN